MIIHGLFLGNMMIDFDVLRNLNIVQILSVGFDYPISETIPCKFIPACDDPSENIYLNFDDTFNCIDGILRENGNIYVHCIAGISRSTTVVVAYLMKKNQWTFSDALGLVQSRRAIADPNIGFIEQLRLYQSTFIKSLYRYTV